MAPGASSPSLRLGALALFLAAPLVFSGWIVFLLTIAWAKALAVLGVVLLLRGGLLTFGHALYYAVGAYTVGLAVKYGGLREGLLLLGLSLLAGAATSALLGLLVARYRGVYFALLNLAFSMVLYGVLLKFYAITGGTDGLGVPAPRLAAVAPGAQWLRLALYELTVALAVLLLAAAHRFSASSVGYALRAVKDNEIRVEYVGASVWRTVYSAYVVAGALGSIAGALVSMSVGHITPDFAFWSQSGEFVFVAVLGGTGSIVAPLVGSIVFEFVRNYAFALSPYTWQMTLGVVLLLIIFFLPAGLWSLTTLARARRS
jgi:branched-chain amino acid transport system permease protein